MGKLQEIAEEFKEKSALFLQGRLSAIALDAFIIKACKEYARSVVPEEKKQDDSIMKEAFNIGHNVCREQILKNIEE